MKHHDEVARLDDDDDTYAYRIDYLQRKGLTAANCRVVLSADASMSMGEQLLIDLSDTTVQSGLVYAIDSRVGLRIRKVFPRFDGMLVLRADHPDVPEEVAPPAALTIIGRVVGFTG